MRATVTGKFHGHFIAVDVWVSARGGSVEMEEGGEEGVAGEKRECSCNV